jgi:hypothetical protein
MRITNGSKIISNDTSKASYSNDPNVKGVTGEELPKSGAAPYRLYGGFYSSFGIFTRFC